MPNIQVAGRLRNHQLITSANYQPTNQPTTNQRSRQDQDTPPELQNAT